MRISALLALLLCSAFSQPVFSQVNHLTGNQWVKSENNQLTGRITLPQAAGKFVAVKNAAVSVFDANGQMHRAETNAQGEFLVKDIKPGVYALTARADYVFACCALHVLDADSVSSDFPTSVEVAAAGIDYTTVKTAVIRYMPPKVKEFDFDLAEAELDGLAPKVCAKETFRVAQSGDGMKGRVHGAGARGAELIDAKLTNVFIMKNGVEAARAVTNEAGEFVIEKLDPGHYSLMAIGPDGLGMIGFELVTPETAVAKVSTSGEQFVGVVDGCCQEFAMQVAPPITEFVDMCCQPEVVIAEAPVVAEPCHTCGEPVDACGCGATVDPCGCGAGIPVEDPLMAGAYGYGGGYGGFAGGGYAGGGGFGGGGGGGFAGGGGFGGLATLAGIGGTIAAIAIDDDDTNVAVASPAVPN